MSNLWTSDGTGADRMSDAYKEYDRTVAGLDLTSRQRRLLANDSHALVQDGMDRHGLWRSMATPAKTSKTLAEVIS